MPYLKFLLAGRSRRCRWSRRTGSRPTGERGGERRQRGIFIGNSPGSSALERRVARDATGVNVPAGDAPDPAFFWPTLNQFAGSADTGRPACRPRRAPDWRARRTPPRGRRRRQAPAVRRAPAGVSGRSAPRCLAPAATPGHRLRLASSSISAASGSGVGCSWRGQNSTEVARQQQVALVAEGVEEPVDRPKRVAQAGREEGAKPESLQQVAAAPGLAQQHVRGGDDRDAAAAELAPGRRRWTPCRAGSRSCEHRDLLAPGAAPLRRSHARRRRTPR